MIAFDRQNVTQGMPSQLALRSGDHLLAPNKEQDLLLLTAFLGQNFRNEYPAKNNNSIVADVSKKLYQTMRHVRWILLFIGG